MNFSFEGNDSHKYQAIVTPIDIAGERLGTLFIYKVKEQYTIDDIILCEYGSTVVGLEMLRAVNEESAEESRKLQVSGARLVIKDQGALDCVIRARVETAIRRGMEA